MRVQSLGREDPLEQVQETRIRSLDQEDPLAEEMATHSFPCLENPMDGGAWWATSHRVGYD